MRRVWNAKNLESEDYLKVLETFKPVNRSAGKVTGLDKHCLLSRCCPGKAQAERGRGIGSC